jgi:hypothetical protein
MILLVSRPNIVIDQPRKHTAAAGPETFASDARLNIAIGHWPVYEIIQRLETLLRLLS